MSLKRNLLYAAAAITLFSCESQSQIDSDFLGNSPFSSQYNFANSSQYTFDSSKIDFANGVAELTQANQTDSLANGFSGGTPTGTTWDGANSYLRLDQTGSATDLTLDPSWTPAWTDLLGYWKMDGTIGSVANGADVPDSSGHGADAFMSGGGDSYVAGKLGQGLAVQGYYNGADVPGNYANPCSTMTLAFWWNGTSPGYYNNMIAKDGFSTSSPGYDVQPIGFNNSISLRIDTSASSSQGIAWNSNDNFFDGNWHYIAFTLNSGVANLYKDGVLDTTGSYAQGTGFCNSAQSLNIGLDQAGTFDEVAVWGVALEPSAIAMIYRHETSMHAGTYTSRTMDGLTSTPSWNDISWVPTLPFFKELPDDGTSETQSNYSSQTSSLMSGIVGLWHLDEPSSAATVLDSSGNSNNGTQSNVALGTAGALNTAGAFNGTSSTISVPDSASLELSTSYTISAWINGSSFGGRILEKGTHDTSDGYNFDTYNGHIRLCAGGTCVSGGTALSTRTWYHVVVTFSTGTNGVNFYVNGVPDGQFTAPGATDVNNINLEIGSQAVGSGNYFSGLIDEVALWSRALSSSEVLELYRRGANRIQYQIRACPDSTCSTNPAWQGPDNTNQTYFSELDNNAIQNDGGDLTGSDSVLASLPNMLFSHFGSFISPQHRYFQYRAIMESDDTSSNCNYGNGTTWCSPELKSVTVGPAHFDSTAPTVINKTGVNYVTLTDLIENLGTSGCASGILYNLSPDNTNWYYWTGAAWGIADGTVLKANSASIITNNLSTFATQVGVGSLYFKAFFQSSGTSACSISSLEVEGM